MAGEPRPSTRERRRPEVTARLLRAVEHLSSHGETFADISVDRLAGHAGISRATFYLYFAEKNALLGAWLDDDGKRLSRAATSWLPADGSPTVDEVRVNLSSVAAAYRTQAALLEAVYSAAARDAETRDALDGLFRSAMDALRDHIERGQRQGWVDPALLPAETAAWLIWSLQSGLRDLVTPSPEAETERLVDAHAELWWHVLYAAAA